MKRLHLDTRITGLQYNIKLKELLGRLQSVECVLLESIKTGIFVDSLFHPQYDDVKRALLRDVNVLLR